MRNVVSGEDPADAVGANRGNRIEGSAGAVMHNEMKIR